MERLFHVSFKVKETQLHELLLALPGYRVGDLDVQAVPQMMLALPAPKKQVINGKVMGEPPTPGTVIAKVFEQFTDDTPRRYTELVHSTGAHKSAVYSSLAWLLKRKLINKTKHKGFYKRSAVA